MQSPHSPLLFAIAVAAGLSLVTDAVAAENKSLVQRVDGVFADYAKPGSPGCAVAVIRNGSIVFEKGYGLASLEHNLPIQPRRTVFDIGSTSKQFTAASILLLVQDGKLSLDDDIREVLPEIPDYGQPITVGHLLHHTSGLRDYITLMMLGNIKFEDHTTDVQALAAIARQQAVDFPPGTEHGYSNTGYFLLAQIVQRISGKPLREFALERIFTPLGMRDTRILDNHKLVIANRATAYEALPDGGFGLQMSDWEQTGDGAVQTTVADLAKWDQNFYSAKVGGTWLLEQLQTRGQLNSGKSIDYARGLLVNEYRGLPAVSHGGSWAGYRAELMRLPQQKFSVAVLCNVDSSDPSDLARKVTDVYLADELNAPTVALGAATGAATASSTERAIVVPNPERFAGLYWSRNSGIVRRIEMREGKLLYVRSADNTSELAALDGDRLQMLAVPTQAELKFVGGASAGRTMQLTTGAGELTEFEEVQPFAPTADALAAYTGSYYSAELATRWQLVIKDGQITVLQQRDPDLALAPAFADAFLATGILMRFQRDSAHRIIGFAVDAGRARDLKFVRTAD